MGTFQNAPDAKIEAHGLDLDDSKGVDKQASERYTDVVSREKNQAVDAPNVAEPPTPKPAPRPTKVSPRKAN